MANKLNDLSPLLIGKLYSKISHHIIFRAKTLLATYVPEVLMSPYITRTLGSDIFAIQAGFNEGN